MAGDWIPYDHDLPDKEEVLALASSEDLVFTDAEARLGVVLLRLCRLWIWGDRHTEGGVLRDISVTGVTLKCGGDVEFWEKVKALGWLKLTARGVEIPKFQERFGASARRRLLAAKRKRRQRAREKSVTDVTQGAGQKRDMSRQPQPQPQRESSKEDSSAPPPAVLTKYLFPIVGGQSWALPDRKLLEYQATYGDHFDLDFELRKARQWLVDHKERRKTKRGMPAFLTGWLNRNLDGNRSGGNQNETPLLE